MLDELLKYELLLASASPRRAELLQLLGLPFRVVGTAHAHEVYPPRLKGGDIAVFLADRKSDAYADPLAETQILLTADTIVWLNGVELGKPAGREEAIAMIGTLSGTTHQVFTGVCLRSVRFRSSFCAVTDVTFAPLDSMEIESYVDRFSPYDKAGGYGIQEWIGTIGVERIVGSYFNVMGLPVQHLYTALKRLVREHPWKQ